MKSFLNGLYLPISMLVANKKRSFGLICGFLLSLICMISSLFAFFAFDLGITKRMSSEKVYSTFGISYEKDKHSQEVLAAIEDCQPTDYVNTSIIYLNYYMKGNGMIHHNNIVYPTLTIDGKDYLHDYDYVKYTNPDIVNISPKTSEQIIVYDTELSTAIITKEEAAYCRKRGESALVAGRQSLERGEVMVAADLLDYYGINYEDAVGKKISFSQAVESFEDFTISGVYSKLLKDSPFRNDGANERYADFWISEKSFDHLGWTTDGSYTNQYDIYIQLPSFSKAFDTYKALEERFSGTYGIDTRANYALDSYVDFYPYYETAAYVLIIFTVLLVFVTILNVFVLMGYSVKKNRGFNTMLKAVGMTDGGVIKVYLAQILILFFIALLIATLLTSIAAVVVIYEVNISIINVYGSGFGFDFLFYLPAWALSVIAVLALLIVASLLGITKNNKTNIVRVSQEQ
ncbi:MAG: hypothetical protein K2I17_00195 [Clostridia bacterium]|nr:hypothetical protein [Clostridia bacterium]